MPGKSIMIIGTIVLLALAFMFINTQRSVTVTGPKPGNHPGVVAITGGKVAIQKKGYSVEASLGREEERQVLFKDLGILAGMQYADEMVVTIPIEKAETLRRRFGKDIFKCNTAGSEDLKRSTASFTYLAADPVVFEKARGILNLMPGKIPVVKLTCRQMDITSFKYFGMPFNVEESNFGQVYLLNNITLLSENY